MEEQKLREQLESLHRELEKIDSVDANTVEALSSLKNDILKLVDHHDIGALQQDESLVERLSESVVHFEDEHPKLSMTIQHILESLAKMGL